MHIQLKIVYCNTWICKIFSFCGYIVRHGNLEGIQGENYMAREKGRVSDSNLLDIGMCVKYKRNSSHLTLSQGLELY